MSSPNLQKGKRVGSEWELLGGHELHSQGDIVSKLDVWICDNCSPSGVLWWLRTRETGIKFTCTWISSHFSCLLLSTTLYVIHFPGNLVNRAQNWGSNRCGAFRRMHWACLVQDRPSCKFASRSWRLIFSPRSVFLSSLTFRGPLVWWQKYKLELTCVDLGPPESKATCGWKFNFEKSLKRMLHLRLAGKQKPHGQSSDNRLRQDRRGSVRHGQSGFRASIWEFLLLAIPLCQSYYIQCVSFVFMLNWCLMMSRFFKYSGSGELSDASLTSFVDMHMVFSQLAKGQFVQYLFCDLIFASRRQTLKIPLNLKIGNLPKVVSIARQGTL